MINVKQLWEFVENTNGHTKFAISCFFASLNISGFPDFDDTRNQGFKGVVTLSSFRSPHKLLIVYTRVCRTEISDRTEKTCINNFFCSDRSANWF